MWELACALFSALAFAFSYLAWSASEGCEEAEEGIKLIYKKVKELEEKEKCLKPSSVLSLVEAARLLAEDAEKLYEATGNEEFLKISKKWKEFVEVNEKAVKKALGYQ